MLWCLSTTRFGIIYPYISHVINEELYSINLEYLSPSVVEEDLEVGFNLIPLVLEPDSIETVRIRPFSRKGNRVKIGKGLEKME